MRHKIVDKQLFKKNRNKLIKKIKFNSLVIINSNDEMPRNGDQNFPFRQNSDLFYLTGLEQEKCILCLCPQHADEAKREIVFTLKPDKKTEIWYGHKYNKEEITEISSVKTVLWLDDFDKTLKNLMLNFRNIYFNQNENPKFTSEVQTKDLRFAKEIKEKSPFHNYQSIAPILTELRLVKEPEEIEMMKNACEITAKAFDRILIFLKPELMEFEVEAEITNEFIKNGANGHAYLPIIASGKSACVLHYIDNDKKCKDGDLLLMDFGAEYGNYAADCSRTIPVNGKFNERQRQCYNVVLRVFKQAKELFVPGNSIDKINNDVNKLMEKEMIELGLFSKEDVENQEIGSPMYFNYYMHGTSHFLGLDVHDVGAKNTEFKKGMVLTCEPGLYIEEEGIGIRIENDIMVDENPIDLMKDIPVEIEDIEKIMNS